MNILTHLLARIASGEQLDKGTPSNTAYWLSSFALLPLWILGSAVILHRLDEYILDAPWRVILFAIIVCLLLVCSVLLVSRMFLKCLILLLVLGLTSWVFTSWYMITEYA